MVGIMDTAAVKKRILEAVSASNALEPAHRIDLTDPESAFTLWTVAGADPVLCGRRRSLNDALALARQHRHLKSLVILSADQKHDLFVVDDADRISLPPQHPGSGF